MSTMTKERLEPVIERLEHYATNVKWTNVQAAQDMLTAVDAMRIALASLEAEPAGYHIIIEGGAVGCNVATLKEAEETRDLWNKSWTIKPYFYTAHPAPVSVPDYPETLPCPVMLEPGLRFGKGVPTKTMLGALQRRAGYCAALEAMTPEERAEHDAGMKEFTAMLQGCNSPVIPDDVRRMDWLVSKTVDVREPMVYGSHSLFWSQTITDEEDDYHATKLREQIDAAMAVEQEEAPRQEVK